VQQRSSAEDTIQIWVLVAMQEKNNVSPIILDYTMADQTERENSFKFLLCFSNFTVALPL